MRLFRYDAGSLRAPRRTPQGFLQVDGMAARIGVLTYLNPDGSLRRELRLPEEVFNTDSLQSFEGAPFTDEHPPGLLTAENAKEFTVGMVTAPARRDGDWVVASAVITDAKTIKKLEAGKRELSVGYTLNLDMTPGTHPVYGQYDAIQRNVVVNHLALVAAARAGREARVRMDAAVQVTPGAGRAITQGTIMETILINGVEFPVNADLKVALQAERADVASKLDSARRAASEADARATAEKARADNADRLLATEKQARVDAEDPKRFDAAVKARVALLEQAQPLLSTARLDEMTDREIQLAAISAMTGEDMKANSDAEVRGAFNIAFKQHQKAAQSRSSNGYVPVGAHMDGAPVPAGRGTEQRVSEEESRRKMITDNQNRHKGNTVGVHKDERGQF